MCIYSDTDYFIMQGLWLIIQEKCENDVAQKNISWTWNGLHIALKKLCQLIVMFAIIKIKRVCTTNNIEY